MPQGPMASPLMKPFVVLALPGMYLFYKYNQYKRKRKENAKRRLTERELQHLHNKIDKLLNKLEESEPELATTQEEECVICIHAKATMQTAPCGHQVVCRKCFVKTIQIAVSQRLLPLRCVICRAKILRLKTGPILPTSASGYSVNSRASSVPQSDSLYSVSSGGSSISSSSCSSETSRGPGPCCNGHCLGAYPRQPATGAIRRSQQHAMKMRLQEYCRPEKNHVNRLPPIRELPGASPLHAPPPSTRIRCAQKILTQLESAPLLGGKNSKNTKNYKYEKLPQSDEDEEEDASKSHDKKWWSDKRWNERTKNEERIDNKKNEIVEKQLELKEKQKLIKGDGKKKDGNKQDTKNNSTKEDRV
ncbi:uncharacterized protein LOC109599697 [Aethina tumida]|uniref:uncharacterized protein LOC109599697 n=1 Tax=Aethina tumida TaxID=116153 RepID=UPI00096B2CCB|nr:uncharacterized protein LOC109599697 [Aethina tumida]